MTFHRSARRAIAAAFALTLLVAACGGDDDSPETESTTTTESDDSRDSTTTTADDGTTTTSTEPEDEGPDAEEVEEAEALAESINPTLSDLPDGWEESPTSDDDEGSVDECFQDVTIDDVEIASVDSPTFSVSSEDGSQGQVVLVSTIVLDEEASGESIIAEIGTDEFAGCAADALATSVEEDGGEVTSSALTPVPGEDGLGDEAVALAGVFSFVPEGGTEADGQLALYFVRTENVVTGISLLDIGDYAFQETLTDVLGTVVEAQARELG